MIASKTSVSEAWIIGECVANVVVFATHRREAEITNCDMNFAQQLHDLRVRVINRVCV